MLEGNAASDAMDGGWGRAVGARRGDARDGGGRGAPHPRDPLQLGLSRGGHVTRTKQLDFLHRFMASPLVPSFVDSGASLFVHLAYNWEQVLDAAQLAVVLYVEEIHQYLRSLRLNS